VVTAGCGGGSTPPVRARTTATATEAPTPSAAGLAAWQKLGATQAPPASLQQVSLGSIQVVDQASGISGTDARAWAEAFLRTFGYVDWAVRNDQEAFLVQSGLGSTAPVLEPNVAQAEQARLAGARVVIQQETIRRLVIRTVPQRLQPTFQKVGFTWTQYAIFIDAVGPITTTWVDGQGRQTVKSQIPPGAAAFELVGGQLGRKDPMGDVWIMSADWDCTSTNARQALSPLCDP
jgi:hypothetical protein